MKKKNPWVAAILNFFFPGIGFAYLGSIPLILSGIVLFISDLVIGIIYVRHTVGMADRPSYWIFSILGALALAVITFFLAKCLNQNLPPRKGNLPQR
jgi:hypothetical protein